MVEKNFRTIAPGLTAEYTPPTWEDDPTSAPPVLAVIEKDEDIQGAARKIPLEFQLNSELGLEDIIRENSGGRFDRALGILKIFFWDEYQRAVSSQTPMVIENVWRPVVSERWWKANIIRTPLNLAWLLAPPAEEAAVKREMLLLGMKRLREAMELPLTKQVRTKVEDDNGVFQTVMVTEVNVPLLKEIHHIVKTLQDRVHGSITQKHQIKTASTSMHLNVNAHGVPLAQQHGQGDLNMDELDKYAEKLREIQTTMKGIAQSDGQVIDTKAISEGAPKD